MIDPYWALREHPILQMYRAECARPSRLLPAPRSRSRHTEIVEFAQRAGAGMLEVMLIASTPLEVLCVAPIDFPYGRWTPWHLR
jgi:hypothetical protein